MVVTIIKENIVEQIGNAKSRIRGIYKLINFIVAHNRLPEKWD